MRLNSSYFVAIVISVAMHGALVALVSWGWEFSPKERTINKPRYVEAKLIQLKATTPKKAAPKPKPKKIDLAAQKNEQERIKKLEQRKRAEENARMQAKKEKAEKERIEKETRERERLEQEQRDAEQRRMEQALLEELEQEEEMIQGEEDEVVAQSYAEAIRNRIQQRWSRPPSARNGMECELMIELVPTGRVINVSVVNGSGNLAFDRSAEQAVKKVEQFPEIKDMPSRIFEKEFRQFKMVFRPEDLRQ